MLKEKPNQGIFLLPGERQEVELRPLTGIEEELFAERMPSCNGPILVTSLLANCIKRIGSTTKITSEKVRNLLIGDRDYLLLRLRQLTFGDKIEGTLACPNCKKKIDINFNLNEIEVEGKREISPKYTMELSRRAAYRDENGKLHQTVQFRLPNGSDQEELADVIMKNEAKALTLLLTRCIIQIGEITQISEDLIKSLSILARREIEEKMNEIAPKVDLEMAVKCPECSYSFTSLLDFNIFFLGR